MTCTTTSDTGPTTGRLAMKMHQGARFFFRGRIRLAAGGAFDLTNYTGRAAMRAVPESDSELLQTTDITVAKVTPNTLGQYEVTVGADKTALVSEDGVLQVEFVKTGDATDVRRPANLSIQLCPEVAR